MKHLRLSAFLFESFQNSFFLLETIRLLATLKVFKTVSFCLKLQDCLPLGLVVSACLCEAGVCRFESSFGARVIRLTKNAQNVKTFVKFDGFSNHYGHFFN